MEPLVYAVIGTRRSQYVHHLAKKTFDGVVDWIVRCNAIVRTGGAKGMDQHAAERAAKQGGIVELVLPYPGYEHHWVETMVGFYPEHVSTQTYDPELYKEWNESVDRYHPAAHKLYFHNRAYHARNYGIIIESDAVMALPQANEWGGAGQGIRIARHLGLPVFNLAIPEEQTRVVTWMHEQEHQQSTRR